MGFQQGYYPCTQFRKLLVLSHKQFPGGAWGDHGGALPLHPHQGHCPWTLSPERTILSRKQCPGATAQHTETLLQKGKGNFANWVRHCYTQKPLCRERLCVCELDARTAGHGLGGGTPPTGCFASGENERNKPGEKASFLLRLFLRFHSARGLSFRFPKFHAERSLFNQFSQSQNGCRADGPAAGGTGAAQAPASLFLKLHAERSLEKQFSASQDGCRADGPAAGVQGLRKPLPGHHFPVIFFQALITAWVVAARKAFSSRVRTPSMVLPPGLHTASFIAPGCMPDCFSISPAPISI